MTEEISKDNCTLSEDELSLIENGLLFYSTFIKEKDEQYEQYKEKLFQKINKLNNIVKEIDHENQKT